MTVVEPARPPGTVRIAARLGRAEPWAYAMNLTCWIAVYCLPVVSGVLLKAVLDRLQPGPVTRPIGALLAVLAGAEIGRWLVRLLAAVQWHGLWVFWQTAPRVNLLRSLVHDPGPADERLPGSPGEALSRFRDDAQNLALVLDIWFDVIAAVCGAVFAVVVMARIDARITFFVTLPSIGGLFICQRFASRLRVWRRQEREATAAVTGFIGDTFGGITAVKAGGAEDAVTRRFVDLGDTRAFAARRDQVATQLIQTLAGATGNVATGIALLLIGPAVARHRLSVGDLGLFASAATVLAAMPRWTSRLGMYHRQAEVSIERMAELLPRPEPERLVAPTPTHLRHGPGAFVAPAILPLADRHGDRRLERLDVRGLTVRHGGDAVLDGVDLSVGRGQIVAVTGPVGAGKSTLVRALLGLTRCDEGTVAWNGTAVREPSTFLQPPRTAYVPQVPRLFSESLRETILLGIDPAGLDEALHLACLDADVPQLTDGLDTVVGPKGVRLSGGQVQRAASARAFVRRAELLVLDDLSSALDVETEARLWSRVLDALGEQLTIVVVSHRPMVLERADQVVHLDRGRRV